MSAAGMRVVVRAAYALALALAVGWALLILQASVANGTLGYDYRAYDLAVRRLLEGASMYDLGATSMGAFGLFFYPPPFVLVLLPLTFLATEAAVMVWTAVLIVATIAAVALLPVSTRTRALILLLAAASWPVVYSIKLGQVGPLLLLLFAAGWRWLDQPVRLGVAAGLGSVIKLQPALVIGWALVTGRRRAAAVGIGVFVGLGAAATVLTGPQAWLDWLTVLGNVSRPVIAENDTGFGRQAFLAGVSPAVAAALHYVNVAAVILVTLVAVLRATPVASYLAVVVASQFVSPVLWDHYAIILMLPAAWLLHRGSAWAALLPLATATFLVGITPAIAYPILFWAALLAVTIEGLRDRRAAVSEAIPTPGAAPA